MTATLTEESVAISFRCIEHPLPHVATDRVSALGMIEDDGCDGTVAFEVYLASHDCRPYPGGRRWALPEDPVLVV